MFRELLVVLIILVRVQLCDSSARPPSDFEVQWEKVPWPRYQLTADGVWLLNPPGNERFDASALLLRPNGDLLTVNDRGHELYRIVFRAGNTNEADLVTVTNWISADQLKRFEAEKVGRWDCEGLAQDRKGRLYVCEEGNRWILRFDPARRRTERLAIDWAPVESWFHATDRNASFEGIAIGDGKLYVANERQRGRIIVVDLNSAKVLGDFTVRPSRTRARDIHYSDLSWFDGALFALLRENRVVVKIDPRTRQILAEYDFRAMERRPNLAYRTVYPTSTFEGLAVNARYIWLVTDNNGEGRRIAPEDTRPALFRCARPDAAPRKGSDAPRGTRR